MPIEVIIMMIGMGLGGHFNKALEESGKETFTKEGEQKAKEDELKDAASDFLNKINSLTISKIVHYGVYCNFQENDAIEGL